MAAGFFCGGVIVVATHVATAAHCAIDESTGRVEPPEAIGVLAGSARLGEAGQPLPAGAIEDPASATSLDPFYDPAGNDYDVAVIRLAHPLWQGRPPAIDGRASIAPIPVSAALAATYANPLAARAPIVATVSGWGDQRAETPGSQGLNGAYPTALQATQIPLVSPLACAGAFGAPGSSSSSAQLITARMLCAGVPGGGRDSCFGDSGGPLVIDRSSPSAPPADYVLAGLVSFGEGCAQPESPGVYASIADPEIAAFLTSNPPQTPLTQGGLGRARYVHACTRSRQQLCRPGAAGHHHHHHRHPRHPRRPRRPRPAKRG